MIFPEYKNLDLSKISREVLSYWEENDIFKKSIENSSERAIKKTVQENLLYFLRGHLQQMVFLEFITYWLEQSKIFF